MPFVYGFLRRARRHGWRPGRPVDPDYGIEEGEHPEIDPPEEGGGDEEIGGGPILPERPSIPRPPVGIWPPLTPDAPWRPIDPGFGVGRPPSVGGGPITPPPTPPAGGIGGRPPERPQPGPGDGGAEVAPPIALPPGMIWPPLPEGVHGKYLALVLIAGMPGVKYRYVVIDAGLRPKPPMVRPPGGRPDQGLPGEPEPDPTRRTG